MSESEGPDPPPRANRIDGSPVSHNIPFDPTFVIEPQLVARPADTPRDTSSGPPERFRWKVVAESVCGASHEKSGVVCQDSHYEQHISDAVLVAAIADGAGSACRSELGAEVAARTAVKALQDWVEQANPWPEEHEEWQPIMRGALNAALFAVEREADDLGVTTRELASTLILLLATPKLVVGAQIGDGAAVILDDGNNLVALTKPQTGEFLNETTFLVSPGAVEQSQTEVWHGKVAFLGAFSDGLQMLALRMSDGSPHAPFFAPLFRFLAEQEDLGEAKIQLRQFLVSPRITQRADDDLTLLLAQWPG